MKSTSRIAPLVALSLCPLVLAAPRAHKHGRKTAHKAVRAAACPAPLDQSKLPRYVSYDTIMRLQREYQEEPLPGFRPFWQGEAIKRPMKNLFTAPTFEAPRFPKAGAKRKAPVYLAQGFPRPLPPAAVPSTGRGGRRGGARTVVPSWVRYPLEFQLCGIGLGTKAVDKDRFNRIDRYGLFAIHGNPTAVVVPVVSAATGGGAGAGGAAPAGGGGAPGGGAPGGGADAGATTTTITSTNLTLPQKPPEAAVLFPGSTPNGGLPDWALAVTVQLSPNQVEWLYKRETYAMGFVVDKFGFCEAVIVAGITSPIARTQQEDPIHTVKLGDDFRKVMNRYGYPDDIVPLGADVASANSVTGTPGGGGGGGAATGAAVGAAVGANIAAGATAGGANPGSAARAGAAVGAAVGGAAGGATTSPDNGAYRTYDLRYDQSYNAVFTIRNNRVVRMYIFGDPDFFNEQRRNALRTRY